MPAKKAESEPRYQAVTPYLRVNGAAKAIDFYLRQVGAPKGVHTLRSGASNVIIDA